MAETAGAARNRLRYRLGVGRETQGAGHRQGRIPLSLRVGVTGHRTVAAEDRVVEEVAVVLTDLVAMVPFGADPTTAFGLTSVSALAEGADRIVAEAVLSAPGLGHGDRRVERRLEVVLPMDIEAYKQTFDGGAESGAEFDALLAQAHAVHVLPPAKDANHAFLAAGRDIARRSDVVVAIWDGKKARGLGGTADAVDIRPKRADTAGLAA